MHYKKGRNKLKKLIVLTIGMFLCLGAVCYGAMFPDTGGHWAEAYIDALTQNGVISGMQDGSFAPDDPVTREQFLKMLLIVTADNANTRQERMAPPTLNKVLEKSPFADVAVDRWSYYYIREAFGSVILREDYGNTFGPVKDITREEAAVWMSRALSLGEAESTFTDASEIRNESLVGAAAQAGLIAGFTDGSFRPEDGLTRAQAATMLYRANALKAERTKQGMTEAKKFSKDLNGDGQDDEVCVLANDENYVVCVGGYTAVGGICETASNRYFVLDIDTTDNSREIGILENDYNAGALALYRYTGDSLYLMGYIETVGALVLHADNSVIGDEWGAVGIAGDGKVTANIGEQFVHTMLLRKTYVINDKNRLVESGNEFYTIGGYSEFTVVRPLPVGLTDAAHPGIDLQVGYTGKIVKTDLKNWLYIEMGNGSSGWIYVNDDLLINGEPLSYYLDDLWYAG